MAWRVTETWDFASDDLASIVERGTSAIGVITHGPDPRLNEFYQKGCQEKSCASTGVEMFSRDPAHGHQASLKKFDLYPFPSCPLVS